MKRPEFTSGEVAGAFDAAYRTMHCLTASAVALMMLYAGTDSGSETTKQDAAVQNLPAKNCHGMLVDQGATMEQALTTFSTYYPTKDGHNAFMQFSVDHDISPTTPLAKSVLTVCLTPDHSAIESISSIPQTLTITTPDHTRR